ncbi:MAG: nicotinate phosphoribosyltransferase [Alphaproteobacteria bacterium]|nr:nicotinate phosphoribosyltransferase [Alphaproteobacteria bacterium]
MPQSYTPRSIYGLAHADLYAFTMAQVLFNADEHLTPTCFHAFARKNPFAGGYILTAGQGEFLHWLLKQWRQNIDILLDFLTQHKNSDGSHSFTADFLKMIEQSKMALTVHALPEGSLAFANTPIMRVFGPIWQCLIVEAFLLNHLNGQSIIATAASRLRYAADVNNPNAPSMIIEGGIRRSQDIGGLSSSLASYIGGVDATSNVAAALNYGIPARGTFSHAFVTFYADSNAGTGEENAFRDYMRCYPEDAIILVDSFDALEGVRRACKISKQENIPLKGVRLDSGDLAYLSKQARKILDENGFHNAKIAASNNLDPHVIHSLRQEQQAQIDIWLVGTHLVVASEQPSLGGVYKLGQVYQKTATKLQDSGRAVMKISSDKQKANLPGALELMRFIDDNNGNFLSDMIMTSSDSADVINQKSDRLIAEVRSVNMSAPHLQKNFAKNQTITLPLQIFIQQGKQVNAISDANQARAHAIASLQKLDDSHKRLTYPHLYITGIEKTLYQMQQDMMNQLMRHSTLDINS